MSTNLVQITHRIANWPAYNRALIERGSINLWIEGDIERTWFAEPDGNCGRPRTYSEKAIEVMALLGAAYGLTLRRVQGFVASLFPRIRIDLPVPNYTTIGRRRKKLTLAYRKLPSGPLDILIDSTGIKIFGEGEWKVRKHGAGKRRSWVKHHIAVDAETQQILATVSTPSNVHDADVFEELLVQIQGTIRSIAADGAYDTKWCRFLCAERGARALIPPRVDAVLWPETGGGAKERNADVLRIREIGRAGWKAEVGYHKRSVVETQMYRQKTMLGERVRGRSDAARVSELRVRTHALNRMTALGMPVPYRVVRPLKAAA